MLKRKNSVLLTIVFTMVTFLVCFIVQPISIIAQATVDHSYLNKAPTVLKKTVSVKKSTKINHTRKTTGTNQTLSFKKGDTVYGSTIVINGKTFNGKVLKNAPMNGTVTSGVIWPWATEITGVAVINNKYITSVVVKKIVTTTVIKKTVPVITHTRVTTGSNKTLSFKKGDTVYGYSIVINGKTFIDKVLKDAPMNGTVTSGVIWPWATEITGVAVINNASIVAPVVTKPISLKPVVIIPQKPHVVAQNVRTETGLGKTLIFRKGDTVYGYKLVINGKTFINKAIKDAPMTGLVTSGVIWPRYSELKNVTLINNEDITSIVIIPVPKTTPIAPKSNRVETGAGKSLTFKVGDTVCGYQINFDNGKVYGPGVAVITSPIAGTVIDGVIWPTDAEFKNLKLINPQVDQPNNAVRQVSTNPISFSIGDTVVGKTISINGKIFYDALIINAPYAGTVAQGIIWPTATERVNFKLIDPINALTQFHQRIIVTTNATFFKKGDSVYGKQIIINDKVYTNTYIVNANDIGTVTNGFIWPNDSDIPNDAIKVIFP